MPEQALYLKWRPLSFDDVVGQDHITRTLQHSLRFYLTQLVDVTINLSRQVHPRNSRNRLNITRDTCDRQPLHLRLSAVSALDFLISSHTKILKYTLDSVLYQTRLNSHPFIPILC